MFKAKFGAGGLGVKIRKNDLGEYAYIRAVMPGGAADKAGVRLGDVMLKAGGRDVRVGDEAGLQDIVRELQGSASDAYPVEYVFQRKG